MILRNHSQVSIKRAGVIITLATTMLVSLAACGTSDPGVQPAATATQSTSAAPVETTVAPALETTVAIAPDAVPTEGDDISGMEGMEGMEGMDDNSTTPTQPATDSSAAATATPATDQSTTAGATTEVQGTLREWAIDLSQQEVPAGKVIFTVTNQGRSAHNFTVQDSTGVIGKTPNFSSSDGPQTLELELAPGTYNIICSLPGHAARGQQTTLVVK